MGKKLIDAKVAHTICALSTKPSIDVVMLLVMSCTVASTVACVCVFSKEKINYFIVVFKFRVCATRQANTLHKILLAHS